MKPSRVFCIILSMVVAVTLLLAGAATADNSGVVIEKVRHGNRGEQTRLVVELDRQTSYRAFVMVSPNRLAVDLPSAQWQAPRTGFFNHPVVKGYRSGDLDGGLTRIIFDLGRPALVAQSFMLQQDTANPHRLVIDLNPVSQNIFDLAIDDIKGDANLRRQQQTAPLKTSSNQPKALGTLTLPSRKPPSITQQPISSSLRHRENSDIAASSALPARKPAGMAPPMTGNVTQARRWVIILDAGHGGHDPGALAGGGVKEKNITLSMARALKTALEDTGRYKVYLTRDNDSFIPLRQRVAIARKRGGDLFISLHADKIDRKNVRGASIYTLSEKASDAESERLADQENKAGIVSGVDLSGEEADVADILLDLAMREKMNESNLLARYVEDSIRRKNIRLLPNSHRSAGFAVLKAPDIPSVLVEIGFLSNPEEAKLLNSKDFQAKMASALREGIEAYFAKIQALQKI